MAKNVKLEWQGVQELKNTLEQVGLALDDRDDKLKDVILQPCLRMNEHARSLAPERTGRLKAAIYASKGTKRTRGVLMGVRKKKAPYAGYVEFGTSKTPPQPFFRPALLAMHPTFVNDIAPGVRKIIDDTCRANAYHPPH